MRPAKHAVAQAGLPSCLFRTKPAFQLLKEPNLCHILDVWEPDALILPTALFMFYQNGILVYEVALPLVTGANGFIYKSRIFM